MSAVDLAGERLAAAERHFEACCLFFGGDSDEALAALDERAEARHAWAQEMWLEIAAEVAT